MKKTLFIILFYIPFLLSGQNFDDPQNNNPLLPGYFADPTIKKFGDTYYIYSTTDGVKLASGQPTVWMSTDFSNWYNYELEIDLPEGLTNCWAPDVVEGDDGRYYYYMGNCQFGCNIYGYVSNNPIGPWKPINKGKPVIPVGTGKDRLPALDAQFMKNDKGELYSYFGTWCTTFGGLGWAKIDPNDMSTILESGYIPVEELPEVFEAAYTIQRNGKYILMYSAGDCRLSTYEVHYAYSDNPTGPFKYGENNPILKSNEDYSVDSPGHHSLIEIDGQWYMLYHRHDNPHSTGGMFRQTCMDELVFFNDTTIKKIEPTHTGITKFNSASKNIALGATANATSAYHLQNEATIYSHTPIDFKYAPQFVTDDNNGTLWKAKDATFPQSVVVDLGREKQIERIVTQFEYPTFFYQYKLEVSNDSVNWIMYSDKTENKRSGSPMIDDKSQKGRYVRLTVTGTEKPGMFAAVWNLKVYSDKFEVPSYENKELKIDAASPGTNSLLVDFNAGSENIGLIQQQIKNTGTLEGEFFAVGVPEIKEVDNTKTLYLDGSSYLEINKKAPKSLSWNSTFTACAWVKNPEVGYGEGLLSWNSRDDMLQASYAAMMYGKGHYGAVAHGDGTVDVSFKTLPDSSNWHFIAVTFDGMQESIYVDGKLDRQIPINLFVKNGKILIGTTGEKRENFTGYIARIQLYDKYLKEEDINTLMIKTKPKGLNKN